MKFCAGFGKRCRHIEKCDSCNSWEERPLASAGSSLEDGSGSEAAADKDASGSSDGDMKGCDGPDLGDQWRDSDEVPEHQKVPFVFSGYRPTHKNLSGFLRTLFTLHNQTGNIWTHLLGFGYFAFLGFRLVVELTTVDAAVEETGGLQAFEPISVLLLVLASGFCLIASVFYHVCFCGDEHVYQCTYTMDLSGIVVLVGTSYFTGITLGYRCFPTTRQFYLAYAACVVLALSVPLVKPGLIQNVARHMIMCVAAGMVPAVHFYWVSSPQDAAVLVPHIVGMFVCYGVGAVFYVTKWPESRWPGRFDLFGHSHQIWHVFVFSAALIWVRGCDTFLRYSGGSHCEEELGVALTH